MKLILCLLIVSLFFGVSLSQITPAGFRRLNGNCPGNSYDRCCFNIASRQDCRRQCINQNQCALFCQQDSRCAGFSYVTQTVGQPDCLFKSQSCSPGQVVPGVNVVYYEKITAGPPGPPAFTTSRPVGPPGVSTTGCSETNEGSEFWLMFMTNKADRPDPSVNIEIFVTPARGTANTVQVTVETPSISTLTRSVASRSMVRFEVPRSIKMNEATNIEKKGVRVTSSGGNIVLYGVNKDRYTADAFLGLPKTGIGREYYTVSFHPPTWQCEFGIAATEDNTDITVTLPRDVTNNQACRINYQGRTYTNNQNFRLTMNRYDAFQAIDSNKCDLTGTRIQSNKPVSVFSGNLRTFVGEASQASQSGITRDHLVEQLYSVDKWGYEFVTVPIPDRRSTVGDYWIFVASQDNTVITMVSTNGQRQSINLNRGQSAKRLLGQGDYWHITTNRDTRGVNKPIQAVQVVHSQIVGIAECQRSSGPSRNCHDPSMINYTPVQQFGFGYTFTTPSAVATSYINRMMLTIQSGQQNGLRLDGAPLSTRWTRIGDSNYVGATIQINFRAGVGVTQQSTHTIVHTDSRVPFGTYIYGGGDRESYGFPTGACLKVLVCTPTTQRPFDRIDNDCDGRTDEEICYNGIDEDRDGRIDEDCGQVVTTPAPTPPPSTGCTETNEGSEYWLMFMTNKADRPDPSVNIEIFVTPGRTARGSVQVTVETPSISKLTRTVNRNSVVRFDIPRSIKMAEATNIEKKGVRVTSSGGNIVLYGVNKDRFTADAFLGLPKTGVGRDYYTVSFHPPTWQCEFGIAATEDNTDVTITLPRDVTNNQACRVAYQGRTYTNGQNFKLLMSRFDAFQAIDSNKCDLTGTRVQSNKPVSVFSGNLRTFVGESSQASQSGITRDHLVEQLYSVDKWGYEFVTVPIPDRRSTVGDYWIFVASQDNTVVTMVSTNGQRQSINLNRGQSAKRLLGQGDYWHITTNRDTRGVNKPIQAVQIVHSQIVGIAECQRSSGPSRNCHDPSMIMYTPVQQFGFGYTFTTPSAVATSYINRMMLTIQSGQQNGLRLDGAPLSTRWTRIGDSNYMGATIQINFRAGVGVTQQSTHTIVHTDSRVSFGTYIYGGGDRESYGFPTGACLKVLACQTTTQRPGDRIDNDCDGRTDEEICYNGIDEDRDGRIDEDCQQVITTPAPSPQPRTTECTETNEGAEYWLMFMTNKADRPDPSVNIEIFVTPGKTTVSTVQVTVETPSITRLTRTVAPNSVVRFEIPRSIKMNEATGVEKKGVRVTSVGGNIVLYGVNKDRFTADAYLGLPKHGVGRDYYTVSFHPPTWQCEFGIAATEDNTDITITLPRDVASTNQACRVVYQGQTYTNGQNFRLTMNQFDAFQAIDSNKCDLTGTRVQSNKPVSVFSGNLRTFVGAASQASQSGITRDHLVEQLYSVDRWGYEFVTVPIPDRRSTIGDYWIFVASQDSTVITMVSTNGQRQSINLNRGQSAKRLLGQGDYWHITTNRDARGVNKPIQAVQVVHSQIAGIAECQRSSGPSRNCHDPSMIMYTPVQQFGFGYTFTTPSAVATSYINRMMLTIQSGQQNGLRLDGAPLSAQWRRIGDSNYMGATIQINFRAGVGVTQQSTHTIIHTNSRVPFGTYIYGSGDRESYGFPTGACLKSLACQQTTQRPGDRIDNDCDGRTDEEICYNGIDEDQDGRIDEDCQTVAPQTPRPTQPPVRQCQQATTRTICMDKQETLSCPGGQQLRIIHAHYGRIGYAGERTCATESPLNCASVELECGFYSVYPTVAARCDGNARCDVPANSYFLGNVVEKGPCRACAKYLQVSYLCVSQAETCRVLSGLQLKATPEKYYVASSASIAGSANGYCTSNRYSQQDTVLNQCDRGCQSAMKDPRAGACFADKVQFSSMNTESWCPAQCDTQRPYVTIDLGSHYEVTGFVIQGRRKWDHWVSQIGFQYSVNGRDWTNLGGSTLRQYEGNRDARTINWCLFGQRITARWVRAVVLRYNGYPAMHLDILRCNRVMGCPSVRPANSEYAITGISGLAGQAMPVKCNAGWTTSDQRSTFTMTCTNQRWSNQRGCDVRSAGGSQCPDIPRVAGALHDGRSTRIGSRVTFTCLSGAITGSATVTCQSNGQWSQAPTCR